MIQFEYHLVPEWPPLAWAAQATTTNATVIVYHGPQVEVRASWFCEAVWDGDFEQGDFDMTDLVFGSGGRLRNGQLTFVSSGSTVDRLQSLQSGTEVWVSNSLACLLAITNHSLQPAHPHYYDQIGTIVHGLDKYERTIPLAEGHVQLTYFNNLSWNGATLTEVLKPQPPRDFSNFENYHQFLHTSLARIAMNLSDNNRNAPFQWLGTLSSGYDSTTNTVLAHPTGLQEVLSFSNSRSGAADDGKAIADLLELKHELIPRNSWEAQHLVEALFIAADAKGEDVYFAGAADWLRGRVVLTGFHGDKVWAKKGYKLTSAIARGDRSGLSLTEYRLLTGFINVPVPFMGVRQIADINKISNAPEMKPWDIPGKYSRPICRRIVEEAGVDRNSFGMAKKAASVLFGSADKALRPATRDSIYAWLHAHAHVWTNNGETPAHKRIARAKKLDPFFRRLQTTLEALYQTAHPRLKRKLQEWILKMEEKNSDVILFRYAFPWAVEKLKERYRFTASPLPETGTAV